MKKKCMNNLKVYTFVILMVISIFAIGYRVGANNMQQTQWEQQREVITVSVYYGDTLDALCYQYKPSWMDLHEYRAEILNLNGMNGCMIYAGKTLQFYV